MLCEFEDFAVTSDIIKRIVTNFYEFQKFRKIREFLRILNTEITNSQSMAQTQTRNRFLSITTMRKEYVRQTTTFDAEWTFSLLGT